MNKAEYSFPDDYNNDTAPNFRVDLQCKGAPSSGAPVFCYIVNNLHSCWTIDIDMSPVWNNYNENIGFSGVFSLKMIFFRKTKDQTCNDSTEGEWMIMDTNQGNDHDHRVFQLMSVFQRKKCKLLS